MAGDLTKLIRDQFTKGNLTHLTVIASPSRDGVVFRAAFRGATGPAAHGEDADPVEALIAALKARV